MKKPSKSSKKQSKLVLPSSRLSSGTKVRVIDSRHAHITPGMIGIIEDWMLTAPDDVPIFGYSVRFDHSHGLAGDDKPSTVFMEPRFLERFNTMPCVTPLVTESSTIEG